ncbi:hypothetical protein CVIRNUC_006722 [Coccomyxa viridis]|uniref:Methyltransferase domain-containing protein n=1 Tax=Coccomyxa viridis TaxID=1274662 RepID=A0AAV1ICD9_9CHLO|nr:hypothetical protein CVIRNUC_006722 [Coccomyxa viridis]
MSKSDFSGLLPDSFEEFRSVEFWDGFFKARGNKAFEWYGEWKQLRPLMLPLLKGHKDILVIGCGNSDLSADMYDDGCTGVTNIDFSKGVIKEMMLKNLRQRPLMKWQVMDMTQTKFADGSFSAIVDKGGLDALMGEDTPGADEAGAKLLAEVARLLEARKGSVYFCVTLAQSHVSRRLLAAFSGPWHVKLQRLPPTPDMAGSPLQPLLVTVERADLAHADASVPTEVCFGEASSAPNGEQLQDVRQIVQESNALRSRAREQDEADPFARLHPGRRLFLPSLAQEGSESAQDTDQDEEASTSGRGNPLDAPLGGEKARYSAVVLDVEGIAADGALRECCVFVVPQGRETEWIFSHPDGQWAVARDCLSRRVILVVLNRGHDFIASKAVQTELSPLVRQLAPSHVRGIEKAVQILTTEEGIGERHIREDVVSPVSGRIVVEDTRVPHPEGGPDDLHWVRRMVFLSTRGLTQSEAYLTQRRPEALDKQAKAGSAKKARRKAAKGKDAMVPHYEVLACEYHVSIVAGLSLIGDTLSKQRRAGKGLGSVLVIGLGGGALPIYLHDVFSFNVECIDLDETVIRLAKEHFGFEESMEEPKLEARLGDGLEAVAERSRAQESSLDVLVVDASGGDPSQAMTCPPAAFLDREFLANAHRSLAQEGLLVVNCVCRSAPVFNSAVASLQAVFEDVYELDAEGDVNRVLFATKQQLPSRSQLDGTPQAAVQACSRLVGLTRAADQHRTPSSIPADDPLVMQLSRLRLLDAVSSNMQSNGQARGH